jgi:hypothetical protein
VTVLGIVRFHNTGSILYPGGSFSVSVLGGLPELIIPVTNGAGGDIALCADAVGKLT